MKLKIDKIAAYLRGEEIDEDPRRQLEEDLKRLAEEKRRRVGDEKRRRVGDEQRRPKEKIERMKDEERKKERARQEYVRRIGQCCAGFNWIPRGGGQYQCSAGGHWCKVPETLM